MYGLTYSEARIVLYSECVATFPRRLFAVVVWQVYGITLKTLRTIRGLRGTQVRVILSYSIMLFASLYHTLSWQTKGCGRHCMCCHIFAVLRTVLFARASMMTARLSIVFFVLRLGYLVRPLDKCISGLNNRPTMLFNNLLVEGEGKHALSSSLLALCACMRHC